MSLSSAAGRVVIYGGRGALGAAVVSFFKNKNWVSLMNCDEMSCR